MFQEAHFVEKYLDLSLLRHVFPNHLIHQIVHCNDAAEIGASHGTHFDPEVYIFYPLSDDKLLDWSKFKEIADEILKCL